MNKERIWIATLLIAVGVSGFFLGKKISSGNQIMVEVPVGDEDEVKVKQTRAGVGRYSFINPLLECDCSQPDGLIASGFLEESIRNYVLQVERSGKASHVSVYFRDLNNGPWFGIDQDENFIPASLFKVPLMIATLKKAERDPLFLKKKILFKEFKSSEFGAGVDTDMIVSGRLYTIDELVTSMIVHSDNEAANLLYTELGRGSYDSVLIDMQIVSSKVHGSYQISVKEYSSFFRILYNASYLTKEMSEKALKILSQSTLKKALVAGLPQEVVVAHKYGQWGLMGGDPVGQLHDCGIVYSKKMPYLICIMTRGKNFYELASVIADISAIVYKNVNEQ